MLFAADAKLTIVERRCVGRYEISWSHDGWAGAPSLWGTFPLDQSEGETDLADDISKISKMKPLFFGTTFLAYRTEVHCFEKVAIAEALLTTAELPWEGLRTQKHL